MVMFLAKASSKIWGLRRPSGWLERMEITRLRAVGVHVETCRDHKVCVYLNAANMEGAEGFGRLYYAPDRSILLQVWLRTPSRYSEP